jgi:hypothetical protein
MSDRKNQSPGERAVLGVAITADTVHAVLLRRSEGAPQIVGRFLRQRASATSKLATVEGLTAALPGLQADDQDYHLEIGDGSASGSSNFAPAELGGLGRGGAKKQQTGTPGAAPVAAGRPVAPQLREILQECGTMGFANPAVAFCLAPPDVTYVELNRPSGKDGRKSDDRKALMEALREEIPGMTEDRVAFIDMTPSQNAERVLAVAAPAGDPASESLRALAEQHATLAPSERFVDAEAGVYTALMQRALLATPGERVGLVRVGTEDTTVYFWEGDRLLHTERLRSVSAYDPPDTVCSRVLLQQDEKRIRDLSTMVVLTAGRSEPLMDAFRKVYVGTAVEPIHQVLAGLGIGLEEEADGLKAASATALATALRWLEHGAGDVEANLLPRSLQRQRKSVRIAWHTAVAVGLLIAVAVFGFMRFQERATEIEALRQDLIVNPPPVPLHDPAVLQARVAELDRTYTTYTRALHVLDSLLIGSDRWITTMERLSRATASTPRTWIDNVQPATGASLTVSGHSLTRLAIVEMARRLGGAIQQLNYQDIGQQRVYSFQLLVPAPFEMPRAALYLRTAEAEREDTGGPSEIHPARSVHD